MASPSFVDISYGICIAIFHTTDNLSPYCRFADYRACSRRNYLVHTQPQG